MATKNLTGNRLYAFINAEVDFKHEGEWVRGTVERAWFGDPLPTGGHGICVQVNGATFRNITNVRFRHCSLSV